MALLTSPREHIEVEVSSRIIADTVVRQLVRYVKLTDEKTDSGECIVSILVKVFLHADHAGSLGERLSGPGFSPYEVYLYANNQTLVDAATGEILLIRSGETEAEWQQKVTAAAEQRDVMLQGDYFDLLRQRAVEIEPLVVQNIRAADVLMQKFTRF